MAELLRTYSDAELLDHYSYASTRLRNARHPRVIERLNDAVEALAAEVKRRGLREE